MSSAPLAKDADGGDEAAVAAAAPGDSNGVDEGEAVTDQTPRHGGTDVVEDEFEAVDPQHEESAGDSVESEPESDPDPEPELEPGSESAETSVQPEPEPVVVRKVGKRPPRKTPGSAPTPIEKPDAPVVLTLAGLTKTYGKTVAVDRIDLEVREGSFYGIIGPNGAGKTTTLSMMTGLLRPDWGTVVVHGVDVWADPAAAKKLIGVLPDRLRLFDRLTGAQLLYYSATLRGMDRATAKTRTTELAHALGLDDALGRLVSDYSAGMAKKVALAAGMIHAPRILVLDEPFESVDPVSASNVIDVLRRYVDSGGTVVLSSHGMDFIERVCDSVAIIVGGRVLAAGTVEEVSGTQTLEERFLDLAGTDRSNEGLEWLHDFSG